MNVFKPVLRPFVVAAIEEQQSPVWSLRSLLDVLEKAVRDDGSVDDEEAALRAMIELADQIHLALDTGILAKRAEELENEKRREAERNAGLKAVLRSDDSEQSPDDDPVGTVQ